MIDPSASPYGIRDSQLSSSVRPAELDREASLSSSPAPSAPLAEALLALQAGSPSVQDLHALLRFSEQNAVDPVSKVGSSRGAYNQLHDEALGPSSPPFSSSSAGSIEPLLARAFDALLEHLGQQDSTVSTSLREHERASDGADQVYTPLCLSPAHRQSPIPTPASICSRRFSRTNLLFLRLTRTPSAPRSSNSGPYPHLPYVALLLSFSPVRHDDSFCPLFCLESHLPGQGSHTLRLFHPPHPYQKRPDLPLLYRRLRPPIIIAVAKSQCIRTGVWSAVCGKVSDGLPTRDHRGSAGQGPGYHPRGTPIFVTEPPIYSSLTCSLLSVHVHQGLVSPSLPIREAASTAILACQAVLRDSSQLFTLLESPQLTSEKKNLLMYMFDKNEVGGSLDGKGNGVEAGAGEERVRREMRRLSLK
jgi:hypothetical protein